MPYTYKVIIINNDTGETKITDVINRTEPESFITIDVNTMKVTDTTTKSILTINVRSNMLYIIFISVISIGAEIISLRSMFSEKKLLNRATVVICITNIIKNTIIIMSTNFINTIPYLFIITGILVFILQCFVYRKFLKDTTKAGMIALMLGTTIFAMIIPNVI